jgi:hypothetical protein
MQKFCSETHMPHLAFTEHARLDDSRTAAGAVHQTAKQLHKPAGDGYPDNHT